MPSVSSAKDVAQAVADWIDGGDYTGLPAFNLERANASDREAKDLGEEVYVLVSPEDRPSERRSRNARIVTPSVRVAIMRANLRSLANEETDPLTDLVDAIDNRLWFESEGAPAIIVLDGVSLAVTDLAYDDGLFDRDTLRNKRAFVSEMIATLTSAASNT